MGTYVIQRLLEVQCASPLSCFCGLQHPRRRARLPSLAQTEYERFTTEALCQKNWRYFPRRHCCPRCVSTLRLAKRLRSKSKLPLCPKSTPQTSTIRRALSCVLCPVSSRCPVVWSTEFGCCLPLCTKTTIQYEKRYHC